MHFSSLLSALLTLSVLSCTKQDPSPLEQLPAATQHGANTFGCLLNGKVFLPNGTDGNPGGGPYSVVYDPSFHHGDFTLRAFRYTRKGDQDSFQSIQLFADSVQGPGRYSLAFANHNDEGLFYDARTECHFYPRESHYRRGELVITRLNKQAGIIAGTFQFTLYQPGYDSVIVTQGRFDRHL
jgi:hypothetical protein